MIDQPWNLIKIDCRTVCVLASSSKGLGTRLSEFTWFTNMTCGRGLLLSWRNRLKDTNQTGTSLVPRLPIFSSHAKKDSRLRKDRGARGEASLHNFNIKKNLGTRLNQTLYLILWILNTRLTGHPNSALAPRSVD